MQLLHLLKKAPKHLAEYYVAKIRQLGNSLYGLTTLGVGEDINTVGKHIIEIQRDFLAYSVLMDNLKRDLEVLGDNAVDLTKYGLPFIDTGITMLHLLKGATKHLANYSAAKIRQLGNSLYGLTTLGVGEDINTAKQEIKRHVLDVTRETKPDNLKMYKALLDVDSPADVSVFEHSDSMTEKKKENSVISTFAPEGSKNDSALKDKIQQGALTPVMDDMKYVEDSVLKEQSDVKVRCLSNNKRSMTIGNTTSLKIERTQSVQQTTESVQHTMNVTIIAINRSFLIEEINTMVLVRAFQDQGITCFDGVDGTLRQQQRAEHFLTILQKNNLLDQLLVILREQGMTYVLDRFNNCRNVYSADAEILRRNIFNNRTQILDRLDIDDVREIFIERDAFNSSMFDEIEEKYSESEDQMSAVLTEIKNSGPRAMRILVDALYINQLDSLADSLLMGTPNELQEIQDNTQIEKPPSDA